jgi:hypothetical protein
MNTVRLGTVRAVVMAAPAATSVAFVAVPRTRAGSAAGGSSATRTTPTANRHRSTGLLMWDSSASIARPQSRRCAGSRSVAAATIRAAVSVPLVCWRSRNAPATITTTGIRRPVTVVAAGGRRGGGVGGDLRRGGVGAAGAGESVEVPAGSAGDVFGFQPVSSRPRSARRIRIGYIEPACTPSWVHRSYPYCHRSGSPARACSTAMVCGDGRRVRVTA